MLTMTDIKMTRRPIDHQSSKILSLQARRKKLSHMIKTRNLSNRTESTFKA